MATSPRPTAARPTGRSTARLLVIEAAIVLLLPAIFGVALGWYAVNPRQAENLSPTGSEAHDLLNGFPDSSLTVEIDYQASAGPPPSASVSVLEQRINSTCSKSSVIVEEIPFSSSSTSFHEGDLVALEDRVRHSWPTPGTAVLGYLFLDGSDADHPSTIGLAYRGASIAVFEGTIRSDAPLSAATAVTTTVLVHEFGHELGLVGIVGSAPNEDPQHPYHSSDPNDVMYWAVDSTAVFSGLFGGGPPNQFDAADLSDLANVRSTPIVLEVIPWAVLAVCVIAGVVLLASARRRRTRRLRGE
ncbi:MAG: hypothetical protein ACREDK_03205 [Thermoplasmata archaeon]